MSDQRSGLFAGTAPVPLVGVKIDVRVSGICSEVCLAQRFRNDEAHPIEAVYVFPLEEAAAVCGFSARVGDRVLHGRVEEREDAFEQYDDALIAGEGAFLLEQERPNVFTASVGNLKPGETVDIAITYVAQLHVEDDAVRLMLPTTVAPRFVPARPPSPGQPEGERVNPERWYDVPFGLTLSVDILAGAPIKTIESPTHTIQLTLGAAENRARIALTGDRATLDRDFVLLVSTTEPHVPTAFFAQDTDGAHVGMVTFFPEAEHLDTVSSDVVFVLDCSGSMRGDSIREAKRALALCIRTLSEGDSFNIVCFGSTHRSLWAESRPFCDESLEAATQFLEGVDADLGGTEILRPLKHVYGQPLADGRQRQILLLTDGQVSNEAEVIGLCSRHARTTRVFSFGLGSAPSEHLVRGVARAARGAAEFIAPGERIEPKVLRMFSRVHGPSLEVSVDWGADGVVRAPGRPAAVFADDCFVAFGRIAGEPPEKVRLSTAGQSWDVPVERVVADGPIPKLWARQRIRDLEDRAAAGPSGSQQRPAASKKKHEQEIVALAKAHGLLSSKTSFVVIETREIADQTLEPPILRRVPVMLAKGWGGANAMPAPARARSAMPMSETLLESELFGYVKGGFTGQTSVQPGLFEKANGGTLFIEGVEALPTSLQRKLLRVLEQGETRRVGGRDAVPLDLQLIAGTCADLSQLAAAGAFLRELADRLSGAVVTLPASPESIQQVATEPVVLIRGQGSKEAVARAVHAQSRGAGPFVPIVCSVPSGGNDPGQGVEEVYRLLLLQRADGSFPLTGELRRLLGDASFDRLLDLVAEHGEGVVATTASISLLEKNDQWPEVWRGSVSKARTWLAGQAGPELDRKVAEIIKTADEGCSSTP